jgi:FAD/FMN-containing dehydrogenase
LVAAKGLASAISVGAGFRGGKPAFFSWLGVTMYLTRAAVLDTLGYIAGLPEGSGVVFDYAVPPATLAFARRVVLRAVMRRVAAAALGYHAAGRRASCLMIASYEGSPAEVRRGEAKFISERRGHRAAWLPAMVGRAWERSRFRTPYLRDDLIESGWFVETFETFVPWVGVPKVKAAAEQAVRAWAAARSVPAYIGAHLSHPTPDGTALYFTVIAPQKQGEEEAAWFEFKQATAEAVVAAGAPVTHHHGIGRFHRPWVARSLPASRLEDLRLLKARWDPNGIMNPGKTLPEP